MNYLLLELIFQLYNQCYIAQVQWLEIFEVRVLSFLDFATQLQSQKQLLLLTMINANNLRLMVDSENNLIKENKNER